MFDMYVEYCSSNLQFTMYSDFTLDVTFRTIQTFSQNNNIPIYIATIHKFCIILCALYHFKLLINTELLLIIVELSTISLVRFFPNYFATKSTPATKWVFVKPQIHRQNNSHLHSHSNKISITTIQ